MTSHLQYETSLFTSVSKYEDQCPLRRKKSRTILKSCGHITNQTLIPPENFSDINGLGRFPPTFFLNNAWIMDLESFCILLLGFHCLTSIKYIQELISIFYVFNLTYVHTVQYVDYVRCYASYSCILF